MAPLLIGQTSEIDTNAFHIDGEVHKNLTTRSAGDTESGMYSNWSLDLKLNAPEGAYVTLAEASTTNGVFWIRFAPSLTLIEANSRTIKI